MLSGPDITDPLKEGRKTKTKEKLKQKQWVKGNEF